MSGAFVCACFALGVEIMTEPLASTSRATLGDLLRHHGSSRYPDSRSRTERLEIISLIAGGGISECSAWIIPMLENGSLDEDRRMD
jgi:hypothetical protein